MISAAYCFIVHYVDEKSALKLESMHFKKYCFVEIICDGGLSELRCKRFLLWWFLP